MKISKRNCAIYITGFTISVVLLGLYFINHENPWCILSCSIGASGCGAVVLAALIEDSNNRKLIKEKSITRERITSPLIRDLTQMLCCEILIVEREDDHFKKQVQDLSLTEGVEKLIEYYSSKMEQISVVYDGNFDVFNKEHEKDFNFKKRLLQCHGGLFNYAVDDICFNRSYNISYDLFSDREIQDLKMLKIILGDIKKAEDYSQYIYHYLDFLSYIDSFSEKSFFSVFNEIRKKDEGFFDEKGRKLLIAHRSWINS